MFENLKYDVELGELCVEWLIVPGNGVVNSIHLIMVIFSAILHVRVEREKGKERK